MKSKDQIVGFGKIALAFMAIAVGFAYAGSFSSIRAFILNLIGAFLAVFTAFSLTGLGREKFCLETQFSDYKSQLVRFGRKQARVGIYVTCIFVTLGVCLLLSLSARSECISIDGLNCESISGLLWKSFISLVAPSIIGVRLAIGDPGIDGECPHCRLTFAAPKDRTNIACAYCGNEIEIRDRYFYKPEN